MSIGLRERIHRRVSPRDLPFRLRGVEPTRTEALADAVVGFSMTLAVVSLDVPRDSAAMLAAMRGFVTFAITFLTLFAVWMSHHRFSRRYGIEDDRTMWLTGGILFIVVFYTFPLKFVVSWLVDRHVGLPAPHVHGQDILWIVSLYGIGFSALSILFGALHHHALSVADLLELDDTERLETRLQMRTWFGSLWTGVPLGLSPILLLFPKRTAAWGALVVVYLVALFGGTLVYSLGIRAIGRARDEHRRALAGRPAERP